MAQGQIAASIIGGVGGIMGGVGDIMSNRLQIKHANRQLEHSYQDALQGWSDTNKSLYSSNVFDVETRNKLTEIATQYLLPQINKGARQSYYAIAAGQYQLDVKDAYLRADMRRKFIEAQGTNIASLGAGDRTGELAGLKTTAGAHGRMLNQVAFTSMGRRGEAQSQMNRTALEAEMAATNVVAPLHTPLHMRQMTSKPRRGPRMKSNALTDMMIMGSNIAKSVAPIVGAALS